MRQHKRPHLTPLLKGEDIPLLLEEGKVEPT